ncbi:MAG: AAA family ATPase [Alphaproteobacteria bacterium]|nr:AAA family ATPase [Alphaproteobacteria bacterium]
MIVGRKNEQAILQDLLNSTQSEFVAVYGRRRVGKTFLIRETFGYNFAFQHTGILDAPLNEQLAEFRESLYDAGLEKSPMPQNWNEAFRLLKKLLTQKSDGKKVIFIDELPWLDTPRSNFIRALDHFWNGWATNRTDIILIVCGSATSWIIENIVMNYGGLHNRLTRQIHLQPFSLKECEEYCEFLQLGFVRKQVLEGYMIMGGIPYYWSFMQKGQSLSQNIDRMFFSEDGELIREFDALYASLFRNPKVHISIIEALARKKSGLTRNEIIKYSQSIDNDRLSKALKELEQCSFIRKYTFIGKKNKDAVYQLIDSFTLFYYNFILQNINGDNYFWTAQAHTSLHDSWAGTAFERVCLLHLNEIKKALGFSAVVSTAHSWHYKPKDKTEKGVQIDLLIDRNDDVINLCEIKYAKDLYTISSEEFAKLRERISVFRTQTSTHKAIHLTFITTYGLKQGGYSGEVQSQLTMNDLFN